MSPQPINAETTNWKCSNILPGEVACKNGGNTITKTNCRNRACWKSRGPGDIAMSIVDIELGVFTSQDLIEYNDNDAYGEHWVVSGDAADPGYRMPDFPSRRN